jgi:hypothetical protein
MAHLVFRNSYECSLGIFVIVIVFSITITIRDHDHDSCLFLLHSIVYYKTGTDF